MLTIFFLFSKKNHQDLLFTRARLPKKTCFCIPMDLGSAEGSVILFNELPLMFNDNTQKNWLRERNAKEQQQLNGH